MTYTKENLLEILRAPKQFKKKKGEIINFFKSEAAPEAQASKGQNATFLAQACSEILQGLEENPISKMSASLIIKDVMDLGSPHILQSVCQHVLPIMKQTVIAYKDDTPIGKTYFSKKPTSEQEQIGSNILFRMTECLFTWACWHYRNSNGTKTRFFMALEGCMRSGVEFPEEEQFVNFTRDEIFKFQGRSGYQVVLYLEDLVNMSDQIAQTIAFMKDQFSNGENTVEDATLGECEKLYEEFESEGQSKEMVNFFPEDKAIYEIEKKFVEEILPKVKKYRSKELSYKKFNSAAVKIIDAYEASKKQLAAQKNLNNTNPSIVIIPPSQNQILNDSVASATQPKQKSKQPSQDLNKESEKINRIQSPDEQLKMNKNKQLESNLVERIDQLSESEQQSKHDKKSSNKCDKQTCIDTKSKVKQQERDINLLNDKLVEQTNKYRDESEKYSQLNDQYTQMSEKNNESNKKINDLKKQLNDTTNKYNDINNKFNDINEKYNDIIYEKQNTQQELGLKKGESQITQERIKAIEKEKQELQREKQELQRQNQEIEREKEEIQQEKEDLQEYNKELENNNNELTRKSEGLQKEKFVLNNKIKELNNKVKELENKISEQEEQNDQSGKNQILENKINDLLRDKQQLSKKCKEYEFEKDQLLYQIEEARAECETCQNDKRILEEKLKSKRSNFDENKVGELKNEVDMLQQQLKQQLQQNDNDFTSKDNQISQQAQQINIFQSEIEQQKKDIIYLRQMLSEGEEQVKQNKQQHTEYQQLKQQLEDEKKNNNISQLNAYNQQIQQQQIKSLEQKNNVLTQQLEQQLQSSALLQQQLQSIQNQPAFKQTLPIPNKSYKLKDNEEQTLQKEQDLIAIEQILQQRIEQVKKRELAIIEKQDQTDKQTSQMEADLQSTAVSRAFDQERASYQARVKELNLKVNELQIQNDKIEGLKNNIIELQRMVEENNSKNTASTFTQKNNNQTNRQDTGSNYSQFEAQFNLQDHQNDASSIKRQKSEEVLMNNHFNKSVSSFNSPPFKLSSPLNGLNNLMGTQVYQPQFALTSPNNNFSHNKYIPDHQLERGRVMTRTFTQVKKDLAVTIQKSKQMDEELGSYLQRKQNSQSAHGIKNGQRSSSRDSQLPDEQESHSKDILRPQHVDQQSNASNKFKEEAQRRLYGSKDNSLPQTSSSFYKFSQSQNFSKLNQVFMTKTTSNNFFNKQPTSQSIAFSTLFSPKFNNQSQQYQSKDNKQENDLILPLELDETQSKGSNDSIEQERKTQIATEQEHLFLKRVDKQAADLIYPFKSPKVYYQNKAQLKLPKGRKISKDQYLFQYIPFPKESLYRFKRACLKWKFPLFENSDLQIGQISSYQVNDKQITLKLGLYLTNKAQSDITSISLTHLFSENIQIMEDSKVICHKLQSKKQLKQELSISYSSIPFFVPITEIEYRSDNLTKKIQVPIPCLLTKFIEIQDIKEAKIFKSFWKTASNSFALYTDSLPLNEQIAKTPADLHACFPAFLNTDSQKAGQYRLGLDDYILGGKIYLRQVNLMLFLKIYLKPGSMIAFKVALEEQDLQHKRIAEFFLQTLLFLFTN